MTHSYSVHIQMTNQRDAQLLQPPSPNQLTSFSGGQLRSSTNALPHLRKSLQPLTMILLQHLESIIFFFYKLCSLDSVLMEHLVFVSLCWAFFLSPSPPVPSTLSQIKEFLSQNSSIPLCVQTVFPSICLLIDTQVKRKSSNKIKLCKGKRK